MRILFTTAWYPNRKSAGDGVFIQKHARAVARLNQVAVLMVQTDEAKRDYSIEVCATRAEENLDEVLVYVRKTWTEIPVITGLVRMFWLMAGYLKGYRYIKRHLWENKRPDVCHVNVLTRAAGLPWLLSKFHGIPYIITEHWTRYARPEAYPHSKMQLFFGRRFVKDAAYVCPVSVNLEKSMKQWGLQNRRYTRVGNVVDTDLFSMKESHTLYNNKVTFVHVSWMRDPAKNISGILRTLSRLKEHCQDFHVDFVGEGNDKEMLIAYAHQLGLDELVTFKEAMSGQRLVSELQSHDAMLMFSNHENQPVSILEALSCGLPVIATHIAAIPSMLAQNRGITVEPKNEAQLEEVLDGFITLQQQSREDLSQQKAKALAMQRHDYVVTHHSPEVIARQFDVLYHASQEAIHNQATR